tara:strand:+ start:4863 stop:5627 length:765 start_codon:yes stop_codon:yes gene_type:complete
LKVALSIVSHAQDDLVLDFFESIKKEEFLKFFNNYTFIVTHNLKKKINFKKKFNFLEIIEIENVIPKSFGMNHNEAFKTIESNIFIVMNPDIEFFQGNLEEFVNHLDASSHCLIVPQIKEPNKEVFTPLRNRLSLKELFLRFFCMVILKQNISFKALDLSKPFWACGIFMAFKSESFKKLRGFDESIFMYYEDADLSRRLVLNKKTLGSSELLTLKHVGNRTSHKNLNLLISHIFSAIRINFFRKWAKINNQSV